MTKSKYIYPFRKNAKGTGIADVYVRKGDELEESIFNTTTLSYIDKLGAINLMIDIGAGEGRYSQYFGENAKRVIAIEPDAYCCDKTREYT